MIHDHHKVCLGMAVATLSFSLAGGFVPMLAAQTVPGCLTKSGKLKRINMPCKKNQQPVVIPLAETAGQLREGIAELAGKRHEIPFHATIRPGEEVVLAATPDIQFMAQVLADVTPAAGENDVAALKEARYDVRLKMVNTGTTDVVYVGSSGALKPQESVELGNWAVGTALIVGHPEKDRVTAYNLETGSHLQMEISGLMLIAKPDEDAVVMAGTATANDRDTFAVEPRPID